MLHINFQINEIMIEILVLFQFIQIYADNTHYRGLFLWFYPKILTLLIINCFDDHPSPPPPPPLPLGKTLASNPPIKTGWEMQIQ